MTAIDQKLDPYAEIEKPSGARLTFRRRGQAVDEMCLLWELETRR